MPPTPGARGKVGGRATEVDDRFTRIVGDLTGAKLGVAHREVVFVGCAHLRPQSWRTRYLVPLGEPKCTSTRLAVDSISPEPSSR